VYLPGGGVTGSGMPTMSSVASHRRHGPDLGSVCLTCREQMSWTALEFTGLRDASYLVMLSNISLGGGGNIIRSKAEIILQASKNILRSTQTNYKLRGL
jgi:hypothetical protein